MKRFLVLVIMGCFLAGCAMSEEAKQAQAKAAIDAANTPKCKDDAECKRFMQAAYAWISQNSQMKIQISNDNSVETYNPTIPYQWGCKVVKVPTTDGGYQLEFTAYCKQCGILFDEVRKKASFNNYVWSMNPPATSKQ